MNFEILCTATTTRNSERLVFKRHEDKIIVEHQTDLNNFGTPIVKVFEFGKNELIDLLNEFLFSRKSREFTLSNGKYQIEIDEDLSCLWFIWLFEDDYISGITIKPELQPIRELRDWIIDDQSCKNLGNNIHDYL